MGLTPDRKKSAVVGVGLTVFGLLVLMYGTWIMPQANVDDRLFVAMLTVTFGLLLTVTSLLIFVVPAAIDYMNEALDRETVDTVDE